MEENKKIDALFEQARNAEPVVGFEEIAARFKSDISSHANQSKETGKAAGSSSGTTWIVVSIVAAIAIGAGAWFMSDIQTTSTPPSAQPTVAAEPQASTEQSSSTASSKTSSSVNNTSGNTISNEGQPESTTTGTEIITEKQPLETPAASANKNEPKSKEEEALFASGNSKNAPPPPIYKKVEGYENKSKTEVITKDAKVTSKTKVGNRKNISLSNSKGNFNLGYVNGQLESLEKNGEPVSKTEWSKYSDLIEQGNAKIAESGNTSAAGANDFMQTMIKEMAKDNLFDENTRKVNLTQNSFTINDVEQSSTLHSKYLNLYKKVNGEEIGKNTVKFKR